MLLSFWVALGWTATAFTSWPRLPVPPPLPHVLPRLPSHPLPLPPPPPPPHRPPPFTPTATPINGFALRDIWARNGCYESFTATGRIPLGGEVVFLTTERRFDQFNRECALVEHNAFGRSIIGWILLMDLSPIDVTPAP